MDLEIEKEYDEEIGIKPENEFMDQYRSCSNNCIFCFIDQMPPGMRPTLYFKDDDSRLSFLQGNYITLTNMTTTISTDYPLPSGTDQYFVPDNEPGARCKCCTTVLRAISFRRFSAFTRRDEWTDCALQGYNDGAELERSIGSVKYLPHLKSVSLSRSDFQYRDGLAPLNRLPGRMQSSCHDSQMAEKAV